MKVGDLIARKEYMDDEHVCGIIMQFDPDGDPIIYWNGGDIEEEYTRRVEVINESR
jgi:hypothetical protein